MSSNGNILPPRLSFGVYVSMAQHHSVMPTSVICWLNGGVKISKRAWATIQGIETLQKLNKGQFDEWLRRDEPEFRVRERSAFMSR